jgi:hypothetical protein
MDHGVDHSNTDPKDAYRRHVIEVDMGRGRRATLSGTYIGLDGLGHAMRDLLLLQVCFPSRRLTIHSWTAYWPAS